MNKTISIFLLIFIGALFAEDCPLRGEDYDGVIYDEYGEIVLIDPMLYNAGISRDDSAKAHINLIDMVRWYGYLSEDVLSAFVMTKGAIEVLFPEDSVGDRSDIKIITSESYGVCKIVADILNANNISNEAPKNWIIEDSLSKSNYIYVIIFERISTGEKVELVWNYKEFLDLNHLSSSHFGTLKRKVLYGDAKSDEILKFRVLTNRMIKRVLRGEISPYRGHVIE
ncbi:MAG: hypothetical protein ACLFSQ_02970 [Candidatus Zixiibacteriota bacterium]